MALEVISAPSTTATTKPPILFVHGAWHAAWTWEHFLAFFSEHAYDSYALSLRGHGESPSPRPLRRTGLAAYLEDVCSVADRFDRAPILVGHSMGGLLVQRYLIAGRAATAGVLLASVPPRGVLRATLRVARRHPAAFIMANAKLSLGPIVGTPELARDLLLRDSASASEGVALGDRLGDESYRAYLEMFAPRLSPGLVNVPMMILGATEDKIFSPAEVAATAAAYGVDPVMVSGAGHDLMLEPGWRDVADPVLAWLNRL